MDISSILPLLMAQGGSKAQSTDEQGSSGASTDKFALISSLLQNGGSADKSQLISKLAANSNPELAKIMTLANALNTNKPQIVPKGLKPIKDFVDNNTLGKLAKYFSDK